MTRFAPPVDRSDRNRSGASAKRPLPLVATMLPLVAAAACGPRDPPHGSFPDLAADAAGLDAGSETDADQTTTLTPDGTWLLWTETVSCLKVGSTKMELLSEGLALIELQYAGGHVLSHTIRDCGIRQSPVLGIATTIPYIVTDTVPVRTFVGIVDDFAHGSGYRMQRDVETWAVHLADPEHDPMPTTATDPAVFDQDMDGKPGVTLILGNNSCEMYVVQRAFKQWSGTIESGARVAGRGLSTSQQITLAFTSAFCGTVYDVWYPPGEARFAMIRVDGRNGGIDLDTDHDGKVTCPEARDYGVDPFSPAQIDNSKCAAGPP